MKYLKQIRLCGLGGQGIVLAGAILGHAAAHEEKWVSGSNSYGSQARGGYARSEVVISDQPIKFPHVIKSDILIALSQSACDEYILSMKYKGIVIYDDFMVAPQKNADVKQIAIPAAKTLMSENQNKQAVNIVILAATVAITGIVDKNSLVEAIKTNVAQKHLEANLKALEIGRGLAEQIIIDDLLM